MCNLFCKSHFIYFNEVFSYPNPMRNPRKNHILAATPPHTPSVYKLSPCR